MATSDALGDWFVVGGAQAQSLARALEETENSLSTRQRVVNELRARIGVDPNTHLNWSSGDTAATAGLPALRHRVRAMENTLGVRLGVLRPEREGAWFRPTSQKTIGPFPTSIFEDPIFAAYSVGDAPRVREGIMAAWNERRRPHVGEIPFNTKSACLWLTLLELNAQLSELVTLPADAGGLKLDAVPGHLSPSLESPNFRSFLVAVQADFVDVRGRLDRCYRQLLEASDRFWFEQWRRFKSAEKTTRESASAPNTARKVRDEFRRRRQTTGRSGLSGMRTIQDLDALAYMGFNDFPEKDELRTRYLDLAKKFHPDRHGGSETAFKRLTKAYSHLTKRLEESTQGAGR